MANILIFVYNSNDPKQKKLISQPKETDNGKKR